MSACAKEMPEWQESRQGNLRLQLKVGKEVIPLNTKADGGYDPLEVSTLWIYKVESDGAGGTTEGLIRKYKPATTVPDDLYLASGRYKVVVEAGNRNEASYVEKTYAGEATFDLDEQETKEVPIECYITNTAVRVQFDASVGQKFDQGYRVYVSASDAFSAEDAENNRVPTLQYTSDTTGFFLLPEGVSNLSWGFSGESSDPEINQHNTKTGVIEQPQGGMQYTLNFKYSKTPDGYVTFALKVQEYEEVIENPFIFSPEPTVMGKGFDIGEVTAYYAEPIDFSVSSINSLSSLKLTVQGTGTAYEILREGQVVPEAAGHGITYTSTDEANGTLSLTPDFWKEVPGGVQSLDFELSDVAQTSSKATARVAVTGVMELSSQDLWFGTADLTAMVTNPTAAEVSMQYRKQGEDQWTTIVAQKTDGYTYSARATDLKPGTSYECKLLESGVESGLMKTVTTEAGVQIPNAGFEEWHQNESPWFPYAAGGTEFWGTGNPGSTSVGAQYNVTTRIADPRPGSSGQYAAHLETKKPSVFGIGKLAAGNIFVGAFGDVSGANGKVNMGRSFTFNAKPKALRIWYKSSLVGTDKGRVFVCLTNMTKPGCTYHTVDTGNPDATTFQPSDEFLYTDKQNPSTLEGHIIAYGDFMVEQSQGAWTMVEIPITYRDQYATEKPNVLILTASASYRGDEFEGEVGSMLDLDDIEFVYE